MLLSRLNKKFHFSSEVGCCVFSLIVEGAHLQAKTLPVATVKTAPYTPGPSDSYPTQPPFQPSYKPFLGSRKKDEIDVKVVKTAMTKLPNGSQI